jgi:pyruvate dehydrogenase (quinone)
MKASGSPSSRARARCTQPDVDGRRLGLRYPTEINLVGDSRATLQALLPLLERKSDRSWRQAIEDNVARWWDVLEDRAMNKTW